MCGIVGLYDPGGSSGSERLVEQVASMTATLSHRGPDEEGYWSHPDERIFFGFRRLEVVGLGPGGGQPMCSADGRWVVVYNGEIYNHLSLRRRLAGEGLVFRGSSDTEVLMGAVQQWGLLDALEACEGMFAFALWDRKRRELHLVRDRFGEKPLYYGWVSGSLAFASELKALSVLPGFDPEIDRDSVALFLRHNCVPAPRSIYRHIAKLEPGQLATFGAGARPGISSVQRYWSARDVIQSARASLVTDGPMAVADRLEAILSESVAARMVADVPLGAFLSGGIDSSLIVALMQQHSRSPVRTFTVGFADRAFDESVEAAKVAAHLGTDHTTMEVRDLEAAEVIPMLPDIWDEPFGDVSQIPMYLVSRLARAQVTVSLSGDGGDELFAGYNRHAWLGRLWRRSSGLSRPVRRSAAAALGAIPPGFVEWGSRAVARIPRQPPLRNPSSKVSKLAKVLAASGVEDAYLSLVSYWDDAESIVVGARPQSSVASRPGEWPALDGITEQMLWLDLIGYLPDDILTKLDRAAMAVSLETRVPYLDRDVFELAWQLPLSMKLRNGTTKWILRQILYRHVPAELVERPKMGFGFPIGAMLRGPLRSWAEDLLAEDRLANQGLLDPEPIRRAWRQHLMGRRDRAYELWDVLALQAWLGRWVPALGR